MLTCFLIVYSALKTTFINADELIYATAVESAHVVGEIGHWLFYILFRLKRCTRWSVLASS